MSLSPFRVPGLRGLPALRVLLLVAAGLLPACSTGPRFVARDEPWRSHVERACLASGIVRESPFVTSRMGLGGSSVCGAERPFQVVAADRGRVTLQPPAILRCPMVHQLDHWIAHVVVPAAWNHLGAPVVAIRSAGSYVCRPINHVDGARLSEHGYANALDVSAFELADGRVVTVRGGWNGPADERAFLRAVRQGACGVFTTVLGPGSDAYHADHLHLDLARHGRDGRALACR